MIELKVGDVVRLKSGGPDMTVTDTDVLSQDLNANIRCSWFDGKKAQSALYPSEALVKVKDAPSMPT